MLLDHETRYWSKVAKQFGVAVQQPGKRRCLVAAASLWGASSASEAATLLAGVLPDKDADARGNVADWLATLYRGSDRYWSGLQPDPLGEYLIGTALGPGGYCADLTHIADQASAAQLEQAMTVLGRAHPEHPHLAQTITELVLAAGVAGARAAVAVAPRLEAPQPVLDALDRFIDTADLDALYAVRDALPRFSLLLIPTTVKTAAAVVGLLRTASHADRDAYLPALAMSVNNLGRRLGESGRWVEGLAAATEAVELYRELVALDRDAYLRHLAGSVNDLAIRLGESGRRAEGLAAATEAVELRRELADLNRDAYLPALAMSIHNLAIRLAGVGRRAEGLAAAQEAVELYRELATLNRDAYLPDLAMSVNNLAVDLAESGRRAEGLAAATEAVELYRALAGDEPDRHRPDVERTEALAASLSDDEQ